MKTTALTKKHEEAGAKMVEFAGYKMPVQYSGVNDEHETVREKVGLFDVSHMGEFILEGEEAFDLLQRISSNDAEKLFPGRAQYSCMPNLEGGIVDDLIIYMLDQKKYMLVVNAANIQKDWEWIQSWNDMGASLRDESDETALLALQGPESPKVLKELTDTDLDSIKFYHFTTGTVAGIQDVIISATGYTGEKGFELYFPSEHAETIWDALMDAGRSSGIKPAGLAARDTLRLEAGLCLYGNDIDDTTSPIEARLGWITKFTKEFVNWETLKAQKENGTQRKLVGFELLDKGIPRKGHDIEDEKGNRIGRVTSGTMSPTLKKPIGMGYVQMGFHEPGTEIVLPVRKKKLRGQVVKMPFLKK